MLKVYNYCLTVSEGQLVKGRSLILKVIKNFEISTGVI